MPLPPLRLTGETETRYFDPDQHGAHQGAALSERATGTGPLVGMECERGSIKQAYEMDRYTADHKESPMSLNPFKV
jgi:hypothetical protein